MGYWSKKVNKRLLHFGRWGKVVNGQLEQLPYETSWQAALAAYKARIDDAHTGRIRETVVQPNKTNDDELTVRAMCNQFLTAKLRQLEAGDIGRRMFDEYKATTDRLIAQFGKERRVDGLVAADFELLRADLAKQYGPVRLGNEVQKVRTVLKYGYESGIIDKPVRFGPQFVKPSAAVLRKHRNRNGKRMLSVEECRRLLDATDGKPVVVSKDEKTGKPKKLKLERSPQLQAMLLLALNCGFGNHDVATLPLEALDLDEQWVDFPRPKTGVERRVPLWQETVAALKTAIAERPMPKQNDAEPLVFVTSRGRPWLSRGIANPVSLAMRKLIKQCGVNGQSGIGFYTLRHVFRTVADGARDQVAANSIMGHTDPSMAGVYRELIDDERLVAVVEHVRQWLFGKEKEGGER